MPNVNLPFLKLLPLVLPLQAMIRSLSQSFLQSTSHKDFLENFLLQAEPPQPNQYYRRAMSLGLLAV